MGAAPNLQTATQAAAPQTAGVGYRNNQEHLADELRRLDLLLALRVLALRSRQAQVETLSADSQVFISHAEVDALLAGDELEAPEPPGSSELRRRLHVLLPPLLAVAIGCRLALCRPGSQVQAVGHLRV